MTFHSSIKFYCTALHWIRNSVGSEVVIMGGVWDPCGWKCFLCSFSVRVSSSLRIIVRPIIIFKIMITVIMTIMTILIFHTMKLKARPAMVKGLWGAAESLQSLDHRDQQHRHSHHFPHQRDSHREHHHMLRDCGLFFVVTLWRKAE